MFILDEICMGGMVLDTNMSEILTRIDDQTKLLKAEVCETRINIFYSRFM